MQKVKIYTFLFLSVYALTLTAQALHYRPIPPKALIEPKQSLTVPQGNVVANKATINKTGKPSQLQKEQTATACQHIADNRQDIYGKYVSPNAFKTECYYTLLGMAFRESSFDCSGSSDQGRSYGCYRIQTKLHGITIEQARDYAFASEWTMDKLVREHNFPNPWSKVYAIQAHQGIILKNGSLVKIYALAVLKTAKEYKENGL